MEMLIYVGILNPDERVVCDWNEVMTAGWWRYC